MRRLGTWLVTLSMSAAAVACEGEPDPLVMPPETEVAAAYGEAAIADVSGNLLRVTVPMPPGFERGGTLWARSGPYFYLFTTATRDLLFAYPDVSAVEVVATTEEGEEVARARLLRGELNEITWPRAIAYASQAQTEGTESPRHVDRLVRYGEDVTEYEYNPEFVPR